MRGYARKLEPYGGSLQSEVQVRSWSVPSGYLTYLETSEEIGRWLGVMPSHVGGTILSSTEFRDALMLRYARIPSNLPTSYDGCGKSKKIDVNHALDCIKGGLVTARHDKIRDELRDLLAHVFSPSRTRCETITNPASMRINDTKTHVPSASSSSDFLNSDRGDLLIRGFWEGSTDTIIDVRVTNLDSSLIRTFHPRRLWNDKRKWRNRNITSPARINVAILHLSWYRRTECSASKPEHFSSGLVSCLQKNRRSPIH